MNKKFVTIGITIMFLSTIPVALMIISKVEGKSVKNELVNYSNPSNFCDSVEHWAIIGSVSVNDSCDLEVDCFRDILISNGWKEENIFVFYGSDAAHQENIDQIFDRVAEKEDPWDTVLIVLTGHGAPGRLATPPPNSGWSYKELDDALDKFDSQNIGVIIHACYSGTAIPVLKKSGRIILISFYEMGGAEAIHSLGGGWEGFADFNRNGAVSLEEIYRYIRDPPDTWTGFYDGIEGELHLTFQKWGDETIDLCELGCHARVGTPFWEDSYGSETEYYGVQYAQSFKPSSKVLTKIWLPVFYGRHRINPLKVSIRKELDGNDLVSIETKQVLPPGIFRQRLCEFDFEPDLPVTPGETYYIVLRSMDSSNYNKTEYYWYGRAYDTYKDGKAFYKTSESPWKEIDFKWCHDCDPLQDLSFVTFTKKIGNSPPYLPKRPVGNVLIEKNIDYIYYASTEDPNGDPIYYKFDWGDGSESDWVGPYNSGEVVSVTHSWDANGTYYIRVKAKDAKGAESDWSSTLKVTTNRPPKMLTLTGPTNPKIGKECYYKVSAVDPNGDQLYYLVDWNFGGDECERIGPFNSSEEVKIRYIWEDTGTYTVRVKAEDIHGAESEWLTLEVNPTKRKVKTMFRNFMHNFLEKILGSIPGTQILVKILQYILKYVGVGYCQH